MRLALSHTVSLTAQDSRRLFDFAKRQEYESFPPTAPHKHELSFMGIPNVTFNFHDMRYIGDTSIFAEIMNGLSTMYMDAVGLPFDSIAFQYSQLTVVQADPMYLSPTPTIDREEHFSIFIIFPMKPMVKKHMKRIKLISTPMDMFMSTRYPFDNGLVITVLDD